MTEEQAPSAIALTGAVRAPSNLTATDLESLPGGVDDVTLVATGAVGRAVPVRALVDAADPSPQATHCTVISAAGAYRASIPIGDLASSGWLAYAIDDDALPAERGGPFRLTVADGDTLCWNVKGVAEFHFSVGPEPDDVPENPPH